MSAQVVKFDAVFDGTDLAVAEIGAEAKARGWAGLRICSRELMTTGRVMVYRLTADQVRELGKGYG